MELKSDEQLVKEYLKGDDESFDILIKKYLGPVYAFVCGMAGPDDAQDIVQGVFIKVWKNIKKFDKEKKFKTWVFAIAKNSAIDFLRKKRPVLFSEFAEDEDGSGIINRIEDPAPLPDEIFERHDLAREMEAAMEKLSPKYREVMLLYYKEDLNFREISEVLGAPADTIKSRHRRGIIRLREIIMAEDKDLHQKKDDKRNI